MHVHRNRMLWDCVLHKSFIHIIIKFIAFLTVVLLTPLYSSNILKLDQIISVYRYLEVTDEKSTHIEVTA